MCELPGALAGISLYRLLGRDLADFRPVWIPCAWPDRSADGQAQAEGVEDRVQGIEPWIALARHRCDTAIPGSGAYGGQARPFRTHWPPPVARWAARAGRHRRWPRPGNPGGRPWSGNPQRGTGRQRRDSQSFQCSWAGSMACLGTYVTAGQQQHPSVALLAVVNPVSGAGMHSRPEDTLAHGFPVARVACLRPGDACAYRADRASSAQSFHPPIKGDAAIIGLVFVNIRIHCSLQAAAQTASGQCDAPDMPGTQRGDGGEWRAGLRAVFRCVEWEWPCVSRRQRAGCSPRDARRRRRRTGRRASGFAGTCAPRDRAG